LSLKDFKFNKAAQKLEKFITPTYDPSPYLQKLRLVTDFRKNASP